MGKDIKEPWKINLKQGVIQVGHKDKPDIAWVTDMPNAQKICKSVNNFDRLLETLKWVAPHSYGGGKTFGDVEIIKQAITKAK